jgi:hypothetical protein
MIIFVSEHDSNKEALEQVEKATESDPTQGEELLESEKLKEKLAKAKEFQRKVDASI